MSFYNSSSYHGGSAWREHICGLYYNVTYQGQLQKQYLPQVELQAHATILATTSRTVLTQTFVNPSTEKGIREVRYTFPLYDGVSVVGFKCHVGDRTIIGEVKEKEMARAIFTEAVTRGETAGLFEQLPDASDVFTTTIGNIAPDSKMVVQITYLGELKHDMEVDGTRFTIPNIICPRYGSYPRVLRATSATNATASRISITVDAEMADGSFIQRLQSPTHPISMTMGTTSLAPDAEPTMTKASASLSLGTAELDKDFILQIIAKNTGVPKAVLETHPTIPNHRALMATLVPKFTLPPEKPELVFVCDRSGSMSGSNITLVVQALKVFLKSLPVGVKFNICSFGSSYSFLWEKSVTYSQQTLDEAIHHADGFTANYGGTEMLMPLKETIERRYKDMPLDVMLLTDGEIWDQQTLFNYLNQSITETKAPIRLFTLGIGNGVSHALIEGVAKAGNGFSQTVGQGEKMDNKVVRMLKGALSPHVNDYTLEVKYAKDDNMTLDDEKDDGFEIVEKATDSLKVKLDVSREKRQDTKKKISLFDTSADLDKEESLIHDDTGEGRYAHLPKIAVPKIIQAPQSIPSLFAFNRTTAYLLLGPEAPIATPKSVVLRGTSTHGPLELEIPIQILDQPGETIHQLAAKKAIFELEQRRGWLSETKDETGELIKTKFEGRFGDMVEREAVRLGVQFQVGGKWCSFVAVESNKKDRQEKEKKTEDWDFLEDESPADKVEADVNVAMSQSYGAQLARQMVAQQHAAMQYANSQGSMQLLPPHYHHHDGTSHSNSSSTRGSHGERGRLMSRFSKAAEPQALPSQATGIFGLMQQSAFGDSNMSQSAGRAEIITSNTAQPTNTMGMMVFPSGSALFGGAASSVTSSTLASNLSVGAQQQRQAVPVREFEQSNGSVPRHSGMEKRKKAALHSQPKIVNQSGDQQDYETQLMLLEQQNKKRLLMAKQDQDNTEIGVMNTLVSPPLQATGTAPQVYQMQRMLFEQQNRKSACVKTRKQADVTTDPMPVQQYPQVPGANPPTSNAKALQDYQMGLMTLRQENKNRKYMMRSAYQNQAPLPPPPASFGAPSASFGAPPTARSGAPQTASFGAPQAASFGASSIASFGAPPPPQPVASSFDLDLDFGDEDDAMEAVAYALEDNTPDFGSSISPGYSPTSPGTGTNSPAFASAEFSYGDAAPSRKSSSAAPTPASSTAPFGGINFMISSSVPPFTAAGTLEDLTHILISHQTFEGSWLLTSNVLRPLDIEDAVIRAECQRMSVSEEAFVTALVVAIFERMLRAFEGSWELVVEKARGWLGEHVEHVDELIERAQILIE